MKIIIEKELEEWEEWWGIEAIRTNYPDPKDFEIAVIERVQDDIAALLDGATWTIKE